MDLLRNYYQHARRARQQGFQPLTAYQYKLLVVKMQLRGDL